MNAMYLRESNPSSFLLQSLDTSPVSLKDKFSRTEYLNRVLIAGECVKLMIMSTFRLDIGELSKDFPHMFCTDDNIVIPTLVLHGDKDTYVCKTTHESNGSSTKSITRKDVPPIVPRGDPYDSEEEEYRHRWEKEEVIMSGRTKRQYVLTHPDSVHILEVLPQWSSSLRSNMGNRRDGTPGNAIPGVHHPKYMLIFTDKGLHVAISTANISAQRSTDIAWCQFFPMLSTGLQGGPVKEAVGADFGRVLEDFVQKQIEQIVWRGDAPEVPLDLMSFVRSHADIETSFNSTYDFSRAQVDLVSVVPGRDALPSLGPEETRWLYAHCGRDPDLVSIALCSACETKRFKLRGMHSVPVEGVSQENPAERVVYGMRRVQQVLKRNEHLLPRPLTARDTLILQPTSIGIRIDNYYMDMLLCHYMPEGFWEEQYDSLRQDSYRLVWPSAQFVQSLGATEDDGGGCGLFLHPRSFASMEFDIHAQFHTYEANTAPALSALTSRFPPHNKSYARIMVREAVEIDNSTDAEFKVEMKTECSVDDQLDLFIHNESKPTIDQLLIKVEEKEEEEVDFPLTQLLMSEFKDDDLSCNYSSDGTSSTEFDNRAEDEDEDDVAKDVHRVSTAVLSSESCSCPDLAWCLLTSACLSRGAQGEEVPHGVCTDCGNVQAGYVEFRNFELGVLFHSRPGVQYRALSGRCPVHGEGSSPPLDVSGDSDVVTLPLPFEVLGGDAYCSEGGAFLHRPYFHENHEANKYSVNQKLPEVSRPSKAVAVSATMKRSLTYDDAPVSRGNRHSKLLLNRRSMFGGDNDTMFMPQSLLQCEDQEVLQEEQLATRAKTVGCSVDASVWSQHSNEFRSESENEYDRQLRAINIADFLC